MTSRITWKRFRHDTGLGKVLADRGAIGAGQIHADHAHPFLAGEFLEIALQGGLAAAQHHVEDLVSLQVTEGGRQPGAGENPGTSARQ